MELSQSLFMLHYFSSFYSLPLYIAVRKEQMGCRTWAFWIIPTLQLFVWRASAKLCILKQKKKESGRGGEAAVEEKGSLLSDGLGQFHQLVGIPDWQSPCLGFRQEMRWLYLAPASQQMPFSKAFSQNASCWDISVFGGECVILSSQKAEKFERKKERKMGEQKERHQKDLIRI